MWTLTYASKKYSRAAVVEDVQRFFIEWEKYQGKFPWVYVLEMHKDRSWHVHIAVQDSLFTDKLVLQKMWGHGLVQFDRRKVAVSSSKRDFRRLARYLTKYLGKDFEDEFEFGRHRYEVAQGFQPEKTVGRFESWELAKAWLVEQCPGVSLSWSFNEMPEWVGPPVWVFEDA